MKKCKDCWYFAKEYFFGRDCCTVDEDNDYDADHTGMLYFANAEDECCNKFEQDINHT